MFSLLLTIATLAQVEAASSKPDIGAPQVRQSVDKSLEYLSAEGLAWETKKCVSCHHGPWMMWSGYEAKRRGFTVDDEALATVRVGALKAYSNHPTMRPTSRDMLNDLAINVTYLAQGLGASGELDTETTTFFDKAASHLLRQQKEDGSWRVIIHKTNKDGEPIEFLMPPLIDADDVTTMWALLTLQAREPAGIDPAALAASKQRGLSFLSTVPPSDTLHALVLRIMLYQQLGKTAEVQSLVHQLLSEQQPDGGWRQVKKLPSDALGTGQAMLALTTADVPANHSAFAEARRFLLNSQKEDGSWFVVSRAYEPPEFSSYIGTAWATLGLVRTLPP
jgi:hypothetical protein